MKIFIATLFSLGNGLSHAATISKWSKPEPRYLTEDCTIIAVADTRIENEPSDENHAVSFACVLDAADMDGVSNLSFPIMLSDAQHEHMNDLLNRGSIVSNESTLSRTSGISFVDSTITIPSLGIHRSSFGNAKIKERKRPVGNKPILVVRVIDSNDLVHPHNATTMGDNVFGTLGDPVNLKSQLSACSFGKLEVTTDYSTNIDEHLAAPGVIEVNIPISIQSNDRFAVHNAVTTAVQSKLGFSLPGPFQQVMYNLESCYGYYNCGWAAYAYINSWLSVYQADYYSYTGVQMHELGHNFGLAHSGGLDGYTYSDHTCLMGNPLYSDDIGKMCFNPAKNWMLTWYDFGKSTVDITLDSIYHVETIVGIAEYDNRGQRNVIIKLETGTSTDIFIGFNRATGINAENDEADDEVTIVQTGNNGEYYSQSWLKATLRQGESFELKDDITITAEEIDISSSPGTAKVSITNGVYVTEKWRILVDKNDMTASKWRLDVHDLRFYSNDDCTGTNHNDGKVIASKIIADYSVPERAFDTDIDSFWFGMSDPGIPVIWIGMEFDTPVDVNCVSLVQGLSFRTPRVKVQAMTDGSTWFKTLRTADLEEELVQDSTEYVRHTISLGPTSAPVKTPTESPVVTPTEIPVVTPTESPVVMPTESPVVTPTESPLAVPSCSANWKGPCLKQGCIYRKKKCEPCAVLKRDVPCFKNGCVWDKEKCASCKDATKEWPCKNMGCGWKTSGCSSCGLVVSEKKCVESKCAWKLQKCVSCVEVKNRKVCKNLNCNWSKTKGCLAR